MQPIKNISLYLLRKVCVVAATTKKYQLTKNVCVSSSTSKRSVHRRCRCRAYRCCFVCWLYYCSRVLKRKSYEKENRNNPMHTQIHWHYGPCVHTYPTCTPESLYISIYCTVCYSIRFHPTNTTTNTYTALARTP